MHKLLHINAHQPNAFSQGTLNQALSDMAIDIAQQKDFVVRQIRTSEHYQIEEELEKHQWAELIILQCPVYWMGVPWRFKQYMDEVYTAGLGGALCRGDGRHTDRPTEGYGTGGTLVGKRYMLSLTFNAPKQAFNDPEQYLFSGKGVDDLFFPMHMNFRFFGMRALDTFSCFDVRKNPDTENDLVRYSQHLDQVLSSVA